MPLKVIVVDDATFVRDMVKRTLRQLVPEAEILEAPDGTRACSIIKSKKPDLILSDWEMPNMGGDELLKWVRGQQEFISTPFIMVTSRGDRNHVMKAVEAGVNDYISKPFTAEELTRKIGKQLKRLGHNFNTSPAKANRGTAFGSIDVLTGGQASATGGAGGNSSKASKSTKAPVPKKTSKFDGKAFLRFPHSNYECSIAEISLQAICVTFERPEVAPTVFDQASVDLITSKGEAIARLNAYIHSIAATEPNPNAGRLRVIARFVDQDPAKMEVLSQLIS